MILILSAVIAVVVGVPNAYADDNGDMFCDGKDRDYKGIDEIPEPDEGKCYGICEQMSKGLACDIHERNEQ